MNARVMEIEAEIEGLNREGERVLAHLEALKAQFDRGLISRPLYEKTVEEAKGRLVSIDQRLPALLQERGGLPGGSSGVPARTAALEPPSVRPAAARAAPAPSPQGAVEKMGDSQARADIQRLRPVLEALGPRVAALEDRLKGISLQDLQSQIQQLVERQGRLDALAREADLATKTEVQRLSDLIKHMPVALEKVQEDISTARIEIKALKYEAEAINTLQEDRIRALEEARAEKKR